MKKSVVYYTDNRLDEKLLVACQEQLSKSFKGEIVSVSLKPIAFGKNFVLESFEPKYSTMVRQIIKGLEEAKGEVVFLCEHDVLYHPSHFEFEPSEKDVYYYNENLWRWDYPKDRLIRYDKLTALSQICANRAFLLDHYRKRLKTILEKELDKNESREPNWARVWGYEPGTKKKRNGAFLEEKSERWKSKLPNIDIRHKGTFSPPKVTIESFKHLPNGWKETTLNKVFGWNLNYLKSLYDN